jgi:hypothetical protein
MNVDVRRIEFDLPKRNVDVRKIEFDLPKMNVDVRKIEFDLPKMNVDLPKIELHLPKMETRVRATSIFLHLSEHFRRFVPRAVPAGRVSANSRDDARDGSARRRVRNISLSQRDERLTRRREFPLLPCEAPE